MRLLTPHVSKQNGATIVEYVLLLSLIAMIALAAQAQIGAKSSGTFYQLAKQLSKAQDDGGGGGGGGGGAEDGGHRKKRFNNDG
ncbi:MAG: hypothetical protein D6719_12920 [Candidatus Dadabacteria bacterium]|nr:MAG: hypothetical protein D6719_12920 [Candidatus Dadabacteria bacterium]